MYKTYSIYPVTFNSYDCVYLNPRRTIASPYFYPLSVSGGYIKKSSGGCCDTTERYTLYPVQRTYPSYYYYYPYYTTPCYNCYTVPDYTYKENYYQINGKSSPKVEENYKYEDRDKYICHECAAKKPYYTTEKAIYIPPTIIAP